jgi:hypothetical protein
MGSDGPMDIIKITPICYRDTIALDGWMDEIMCKHF